MHFKNALKLVPFIFLLVLSQEQPPAVHPDFLNSQFKLWNDSLPEDRLYVQCDKPFYAPGETVWFSVFVRDGRSFKPSTKSDIVHVELLNPKGSIEKQLTLLTRHGIAQGDIAFGSEIPGGIYSLKVYTSWQKNDSDPAYFVKELQVQDVVLPRCKMKLDFAKKAYGAGDKVIADFSVTTNENKPLSQHPLQIVVSIAGAQLLNQTATTDANGKVPVTYQLPAKLVSNDGLLNVSFDYDGQTESISRAIPIVLNKIDLTFYPEGGDLVVGLASRIAFKALNEFGKGADISGYIADNTGANVATFESFHQGMGACEMTPGDGKTYTAHITRPVGITETYTLPEAMQQGYVLSVEPPSKTTLTIAIGASRNEKLRIFIQVRGKQYYSKSVDAKKGSNRYTVDISQFPAGVAQITLFDAKEIERAERLFFVNKYRQARISIKTDKEKYQPREKVKMTITATDETGMRMPGNVALAVTDDQLLSFADDKSSTILSWMLAEAEVKGKIDEPRFYFDPKEAKADRALDYLMLTHGWRRFTWKELRENEAPSISNPAERAIIAGTVMDRQTGKPVAGAEVKVEGHTVVSKTDTAGRFVFKNVELFEPVTVVVTKGNLKAQVAVATYRNDVELWVNEQQYIVEEMERQAPVMKMMDAAPPEAGGDVQRERLMKKIAEIEKSRKVLRNNVADVNKGKGGMANAIAPAKPRAQLKDNDVKAMPAAGLKKQAARKAMRQDFEPAPIMKEEALFEKGGFVQRAMVLPPPSPEPPAVVYYRAREFAMPDYKEPQQIAIRTDFRSTIFWKGDVELKSNGSTAVEFYTNDAVTSFRAVAEGFTSDGMVGRGEQLFYSQMPFALSAKIPPVLITGDTVELQLLVKNTTAASVNGALSVAIPPELSPLKKIEPAMTVEPASSRTVHVAFAVVKPCDSATLVFAFEGQGFSDEVKQKIRIIPQGFPVDLSFSGNELSKEFPVTITNCIKNSISAALTAYPSVVSDLLAGIESILQEPYGCFEQTSMSSYPNALVLSYLKTTDKADPALVQRAEELLGKGYNRLVNFETKEKGYEWFGGTPAHEALTAYGIMQFSDMQKVGAKVDVAMIDRTAEWLMKRRDNSGGFLRNPQALDSYGGADQNITNAYIVYALAEAGRRDIQKELDASVAYARESGDPYVVGLVANALFCFGNANVADELLKGVTGKQAADGSWCGLKHSITRSEGISLKLETTSLVTLALMKSKQPNANALTAGIKFIVASRSGSGGFGATQSTIMSLKALTAYAQFARKTDSPGTIVVAVNTKEVARKSYGAGEKDAIIIDSLEKYLADGEQKLTVRYEGTKTVLPYSLAVSYYTHKPASSEACKVTLQTVSAATSVKVGQTLRVTTVLKNTTQEGLPMTIAILGLPAGVSAQPWQLKELQEKKMFDFYEITGSTVVFYYRQMKPAEARTVSLDCKAEVPGYYSAPASRAYLYYTNEYKVWTSTAPLRVVK